MKNSLVNYWMTTQMITAAPHIRLHDALRLMNRARVRSLPVVDNGHLVGIVTKRDLLRSDATSVMKESWDQYRLAGNLPLEKIMSSAVITIRPDAHIAKAARVLLENKITALPVLDSNQTLVGILTASDLFRMIQQEVPLLHEQVRVNQFMTSSVQTITPDTSLLDAQRLMAVKRIRSLPVVQDSLLVGIVTRTDLLSAAPSVVTTQGRLEVTEKVLATPIRFIMTSSPLTIAENALITQAAGMMLENKIHSLPVIDSDLDLCGIITESDLFRLVVNRFLS